MQTTVARPSECPFCSNDSVCDVIQATEKMFGLSGEFTYGQCGKCRSLYITSEVPDLALYYPSNYYSYEGSKSSRLLSLVEDVHSRLQAVAHISLLRRAGLNPSKETSFVDVGSGAGTLLRAFQSLGYKHVSGIDPYLHQAANTNGISVIRDRIENVAANSTDRSDVVMFHHSLEHVADPLFSLQAAEKLLSSNGVVLLRVPIVNFAWERYRNNWVGLDAPRHLSIPTQRGVEMLAARAGLKVMLISYDSTSVQFVASEALEKGFTLNSAFPSNPVRTTLRAIRSIPKSLYARKLNKTFRGDQAAFVLTRID